VVLTEEDYRDEDVHDIMNQIEMGAKQSSKLHVKNYELFKIEDRQKAVTKAIENAQKGDVVLLTGKGHERSLCRGTKEYPWSEHEAVKKALKLKVTS
jgi:UDP-N-acetylmuramoyl-L-alanyl-D-glutamate--2,6-diaminopimelate ligase